MEASDSSKKKHATNQYLISTIKERDEKISRLKVKLTNLKDQLAQRPLNADQFPSAESVLNDINSQTGNSFRNMEQCISYFAELGKNAEKIKIRNDISKYEFNSIDSNESNSKKSIVVEMELNDRIYDLEMQLSSLEKKFNKKLKDKDNENEDLRDEISTLQSTKSKDAKYKHAVKQLEEKMEDLASDLESKTNDIKLRDSKIRELNQKHNFLNSEMDLLNEKITKDEEEKKNLRGEIMRLSKEVEKLNRQNKTKDEQDRDIKNLISSKEDQLEKKQKAMDTMKKKIENLTATVDEWKTKANKNVNDLEECRKCLDDEKNKSNQYKQLSNEKDEKIKLYEKEIKHLKGEIDNNRVKNVRKTEETMESRTAVKENRGKPMEKVDDVFDKHNKPEEKPRVTMVCPNCHTMFDIDEMENHINECLDSND